MQPSTVLMRKPRYQNKAWLTDSLKEFLLPLDSASGNKNSTGLHFGPTRPTVKRVPRKKLTKKDIYWGLYGIHNFVFLTFLKIFVPRLKMLFCINNYFLVCIFKYRKSSRVNSGLEI